MKIVQTFWSCNRDLIQNSFGWQSPQHHVMGWALSCLKLKEHYDDLHLYTDANGIAILIDYLGLPYKTATSCYDGINKYCRYLWAMPKVMTYAVQAEPFIHVDGDIFIWDKFSPDLENSDLIAQNLETDNGFYKGLMNEVLESIKNIPDFLEKELTKEFISSYNVGIFGGKDIAFIKKYCDSALRLINNNYNVGGEVEAPLNFNLLFEQILFYTLTDMDSKTVTCFSPEEYNNNYTIGDYADFNAVPHRLKYLHLIGHHKRNATLCDLMSRTLFKEYPEYYYKIVALFNSEHAYFESKIKGIYPIPLRNNIPSENKKDKIRSFPYSRTQHIISKQNNNENVPAFELEAFVENSASVIIKDVFQFETQLASIIDNWANIPGKELHENERMGISYTDFFFKTKEEQLTSVFERNPYVEILEESYNWERETKASISPYLVNDFDEVLGLAYIPQLFFSGYREVVIDEIDYNIIAVLEEPTSFRDLLVYLKNWFTGDDDVVIYDLTLIKLRHLFGNQCVFVTE